MKGKKTYLLVFFAVVKLVEPLVTGEVGFLEFLQGESFLALLGALGIGTVHAGVARNGK